MATSPDQAPEKYPLSGLTVLVTGGTRGIGGATSLLLAQEGASVIATYRDPGKEGRVQELVNQAAGLSGKIVPVLADITKPSQREGLRRMIYEGDYHIDVLVSNAAGGIDNQNPLAVNSSSKIALIRDLAPLFSDPAALVVEIESSWSRFYPYVEQLPMYDPVASSKKRGRERLLGELPVLGRDNKIELGLGFICGHAVDGTATVKLLKRAMSKQDDGKEKWEQLVATAEGGKLPTTEDMAQAVLETINKFRAGELKFGEERYVGVPNWDQEETKRRFYMYGPTSLYIGSTVFHTPDQNFSSTEVKQRHLEPLYKNGLDTDVIRCVPNRVPLATFVVDEESIRDHFTEKTGLQITPGYKLVAAAQLSYARYLHEIFSVFGEEHFRWDGIIGETKFERPVPPRARVDILLGEEFPVNGGRWSGNIELKVGEVTVATVNGVLMRPGVDRNRHLKPRLIEIAAQAAGAQFMHRREFEDADPKDLVPLFRGIGSIEFSGVAKEGDVIETEVKPREIRRNGFVSDAILRVDNRVIARINEINCGVLTGGAKAIERIKRSIQQGVVS